MVDVASEQGESHCELTLNFNSLGQGPLARILSFLSIRDICKASLAFRALRDAGRNDMVWYAKALEKRYPQNTLKLSPASPYPDFRSLVLDDNRENASLLLAYDNLPFGGFSSEYKMNRPDYFFECCITGVQYNRKNATTATDNLQIFFDCRGEGGGGGGNRGGLDLVFTYANPVHVLPQMNQVDYHPVALLTLPPATSFTESMTKEGKYSSPDDFSEKFLMQEMSVEEERKRWSHVEREMEIGGRGGRRTAMPGGGSGSGGGRFTSWFV